MKVLWVSASPIGPAAEILGREYSGSSGGWIQTEYEALYGEDVELGFLSALPDVEDGKLIKKCADNGVAYCVHSPRISYGIEPSQSMLKCIKEAISDFRPNIIQLWGTESLICYAASLCAPEIEKVIFLQGILGIHCRHKSMISTKYVGNHSSVMDKIKNSIKEKMYYRQALLEKIEIQNCRNVIGDSSFSLSYCESVCENLKYFKHILKPNAVFYSAQRDCDNYEDYSIFTTASKSPMKGLDELLKAVVIVKKTYPEVKLYIPGNSGLYNVNGMICADKGATQYELGLKDFIEQNMLESNIIFLGKLSPDEMSRRLESVAVFVNPSYMETHALSLREAMTVGVPSVTSLCGSVIEYFAHGEYGYIYRNGEYEMLANFIKKLFDDRKLATRMGENAKKVWRAASEDNMTLCEIYDEILT